MAYKQVGIIAARAPNGDFLPAVPIYREVGPVNERGATDEEERAADWAARLAAEKIKAYKNGRRKAEKGTALND